ncbi:TonB-dependent receptor plug domain-containing protein [Helicobacter sp. 23-1048]
MCRGKSIYHITSSALTLSISCALCAGGALSARDIMYLAQNDDPNAPITQLPQQSTERDPNDFGIPNDKFKKQAKAYSSGSSIDKPLFRALQAEGGDMSNALKILPNVQLNDPKRTANTAGELNPASISISGGLPAQNNFLLDGFSINNDLDPFGGSGVGGMLETYARSGFPQGLNVDTSLLDSITVLDSNISARYGRFSGGIVESTIRKPRTNGLHGTFSAQYANSNFSNLPLQSNMLPNLYSLPIISANSRNENYQPNFSKTIYRASLETYLTEHFAILAGISFASSSIPLSTFQTFQVGSNDSREQSTGTKDQTRANDNYFVKLFINPNENFNLEYNFAYMPQSSTYFHPNTPDSTYVMKSGGRQMGVKTSWDTEYGLWLANVNYSNLENSRDTESSFIKNPTTFYPVQGFFPSINQKQDTLSVKNDFAFTPLESSAITHSFLAGLEFIYQKASMERTKEHRAYIACGFDLTGAVDIFGVNSSNCANYDGSGTMYAYSPIARDFSAYSYSLYGEDEAEFDLGRGGEMNARLGLRLDGDFNYFKRHKIAPRFSLTYITPAPRSWRTEFTLGANRYYARNLITYGYRSLLGADRLVFTRANNTSPWQVVRRETASYRHSVELNGVDLPYDDELMGAITQNLSDFVLSVKYISRSGKKQITNTPTNAGVEILSNNGSSSADIISASLSHKEPLLTGQVEHFYYLSLDWSNARRNYNPYINGADMYSANDIVILDGVSMPYSAMPSQKINQPLTIRLNASHSTIFKNVKLNLNNFLRFRDSYQQIVLTNMRIPTGGGMNYTMQTMNLQSAFMWDMRIGLEREVWKGSALFVNIDIYNVLNSKNLTTLGVQDGVLLFGIPTGTSVLMYEMGRSFWAQVGFKF